MMITYTILFSFAPGIGKHDHNDHHNNYELNLKSDPPITQLIMQNHQKHKRNRDTPRPRPMTWHKRNTSYFSFSDLLAVL